MTDRELLEAAAKAAGILIYFDDVGQCCQRVPGDQLSTYLWEPLEDDGDALRLAVKLGIDISQFPVNGRSVYAGYWGKPERRDVTRMFCIELLGSDPYAATRRAIVRAAAEIGKSINP